MRKLATFIVGKRKLIMILFAVAAVLSIFTSGLVKVNSDLYSFLPESTETRQALGVMDGEFTTFSTAKVMVRDIGYSDALALYQDIKNVDGVKSVTIRACTTQITAPCIPSPSAAATTMRSA